MKKLLLFFKSTLISSLTFCGSYKIISEESSCISLNNSLKNMLILSSYQLENNIVCAPLVIVSGLLGYAFSPKIYQDECCIIFLVSCLITLEFVQSTYILILSHVLYTTLFLSPVWSPTNCKSKLCIIGVFLLKQTHCYFEENTCTNK